MTTLNTALAKIKTTLQAAHGDDIEITLVKAPAFGDAVTQYLVYGTNCASAAMTLAAGYSSAVFEELHGGGLRGRRTYTYVSVTF